ncbi:MAG: DUF763 domain-containing protein [Ferroplasma sp.]
MQNNGSSILPLHYGHPPEYLYSRMVKLGGIISDIMIKNYSTDFFLGRLGDPFWFHSLSLAIGFDWNSSGTTTATLSALKEYAGKSDNIRILGGKGPHIGKIGIEFEELEKEGTLPSSTIEKIRKDAKTIGKVDEKLLQDGFDLYMQFIIIDYHGNYTIVNQGMNKKLGLARRYHWIKNNRPFYDDKRNGISGYENSGILDLSSKNSSKNRDSMIDVIKDNPLRYSKQRSLDNFMESSPFLDLNYSINWDSMRNLYEYNPDSFDELMEIKGMSRSTLRALSYLAEIVYGNEPSFTDPVKFSFCLGGKDGVPKPVNVADYDMAIEFYNSVLKGNPCRENVLKRLASMSYKKTGAFKVYK